jgi:hypothetical protein
VDDLDAVAVRILEVAGARAVAMRARRGGERHAATFQKRRPPVHIRRRSHNQSEVIERGSAGRRSGGGR